MKKITTIILVIIAAVCNTQTAQAQFTVEATYDSSYAQLYVVKLEVAGEKFIRLREDSANRKIQLYNLNHSLWKTIDLNNMPVPMNISLNFDSLFNPYYDTTYTYTYDVLYVTQHLFNLNDNIELMFVSRQYTRIVDEFGAVLFSTDSAGPWITVNIPQVMKPIYNTAAGTKMILSGWNNQAKVYSLPGLLTVENEMPVIGHGNNTSINSYPNPVKDYATVDYELPNGVNEGQIVFYNMNGREVKSLQVDRTFHDLRISISDLPAGTYLYQLQTANGSLGAKKMVVIK